MPKEKGFSLIELLVVAAVLAVLGTAVVLVINPVSQFAQARNKQRLANVNTILNAVGQNIADNKGTFSCASGSLPTSSAKMADNNPAAGDYNIAPCLVPAYLAALPFDPAAAGAHYASNADYDTGYYVFYATSTGRTTVSAPSAELGETVSVTR